MRQSNLCQQGLIAKFRCTGICSMKDSTTCEKSELIKTHTARRSAATNMYHAGIKTIDIMKITGHTLENNFLKYIKVIKEETADMLAKHPYFTGKGKLRVVK